MKLKEISRIFSRRVRTLVVTGSALFLAGGLAAQTSPLKITAYDAPIDNVAGEVHKQLKAGKVVFFGEVHTSYAGHLRKRDILRRVVEKPGRLRVAIGMEMFPAAAQGALDDYIQRKITEKEFLKNSRYFEEWGFDYNLYKPIIDLAREQGLRLVGLNIEKDMARKIGREGFGALSARELGELPAEMEYTEGPYRRRLRESYQRHQEMIYGNHHGGYLFQNFYLAQLVRDETMARSAARFLENNPGTSLVVIAGNGHIAFGDGIPRRLTRISGKDVYLVAIDQPYNPEAADHFVYSQEVEFTGAPRLFVMLDLSSERPRVLKIDAPEEASHPLREGDTIVAIDGAPVATLGDIKIALYSRKYGETITVEVERDGERVSVKVVLVDYSGE